MEDLDEKLAKYQSKYAYVSANFVTCIIVQWNFFYLYPPRPLMIYNIRISFFTSIRTYILAM